MFDVILFNSPDKRAGLTPRAVDYARRSIALDPMEVRGHCALALALMDVGRYDESITQADVAVSLDPSSAWACYSPGLTRAWGGRPREAIEPLKTAIRLSPFDPWMTFFLGALGRAYYWMGDYHAAVTTSRQICQSYPNLRSPYRRLLAGLGQTGQAEEALREMAEALERFGAGFRPWLLSNPPNPRSEDHEHLLEGYRKAGVLGE